MHNVNSTKAGLLNYPYRNRIVAALEEMDPLAREKKKIVNTRPQPETDFTANAKSFIISTKQTCVINSKENILTILYLTMLILCSGMWGTCWNNITGLKSKGDKKSN